MAAHSPHYQVEDVQLKALRGNLNDITERIDVPDDSKEAAERAKSILSDIERARSDTPTRKDYRHHVEQRGKAVIDALTNYDEDDVGQIVRESADGSAYTMYHSKAMKVLEYSTNEPDEWAHLVDESRGWTHAIRVMAYTVLTTDIYEYLESIGFLTEHWEINEHYEHDTEE